MVPSRPSLVATSLSRWASSSAPRAKTARPPKSQLQTPKASGSSQTTSSASTGSSSKPTSWSSPSKRQQRANVVQQSRFNATHPSHNQLSKASPSRTRGTAAAPSSSTPTHSRVTLNSTTYPAASGPYSSPTSNTAGKHVKGGENKSLWQSWKNIPPRNRMAVGVFAGIIGILGVVLDNQSESIFPSLQSKPHEKINGEEEPKLIAFKIKDRVEQEAPAKS